MKGIFIVLASIIIIVAFIACSKKPAVISLNPELEGTKFITATDLKGLLETRDDVVLFGVLSSTKAIIPLTDESTPIEGTFRVWRPDYSGAGNPEALSPVYGGFRKTKEQMEELLSKADISKDDLFVVYSTGAMHDMTRFGWQLELMGLEVLYLDGGLNAWKAANFPTGSSVELAKQNTVTEFKADEWNTKKLNATMDDVIKALENPDEWVVIDTRSTGEYNGDKTGSSAGAYGTGSIKDAVHIEWKDAVNSDNTLKSKEELEALYGDVIKGKKVITYCQSGVRSSHTQLVLMEMLGAKDVYNYDGSWIEWSYVASNVGDDIDPELKEKVISLTDNWTDNNGAI